MIEVTAESLADRLLPVWGKAVGAGLLSWQDAVEVDEVLSAWDFLRDAEEEPSPRRRPRHPRAIRV